MDNNTLRRDKFQEEQNELLKTILTARFFHPWTMSDYTTPKSKMPKGSLELYITSDCNQKCEYCYLQKYPNELYPINAHNHDIIIKNLRHLLDWIVDNHFYLPNLDLFSGEILHTPFGLEILDVIYEYITVHHMPLPYITIPTNGTFILDEHQTIELQNRIDNFRRLNTKIQFSFSLDGKIIEDLERPRNDNSQIRNDDFYEKVFCFAKHNHFGFHPMLSAKSAKYWIENWKWWMSMFKKYNIGYDSIMLLEVRNIDWEEEDIQAYKEFIDYLVDSTYKYHGGNMGEFMNDMLLLNQVYGDHQANNLLWGEDISYIPCTFGDAKGIYGCTIQSHLTVRLGDLAIAPCHRSSYNKYLYGYFKQDQNGKIIDIIANNPQVAINLLMLDTRYGILGCDTCKMKPFCLGTCKGQSIESQQDPFHNDPRVCNFLLNKYTILFDSLDRYNGMTWLDENLTEYHSAYELFNSLLQIWKQIKKEREDERLEQLRQNLYS